MAFPSSSLWSSPCLLTPKPDGRFRFCRDYWKVNTVIVPNSFPLPRIYDCVDSAGSAVFVLKGYCQIPLTASASTVSAFETESEIYFLSHCGKIYIVAAER